MTISYSYLIILFLSYPIILSYRLSYHLVGEKGGLFAEQWVQNNILLFSCYSNIFTRSFA